jgi:NADH-quinone oxidoreductase subunit J
MKENLHIFFSVMLLACALLASFSLNPVESVLFLILCFYLSACILFLFNVEFLALTYIVVYVGAVAVLFLFIIMMLDIRIKKNIFNKYKFLIYFFLVAFIYIAFISVLTLSNNAFDSAYSNTAKSPLLLVDTFSNIEVFGQVLYNYHVVNFLIAGIILLVALVGCVVITLDHNRSSKKYPSI